MARLAVAIGAWCLVFSLSSCATDHSGTPMATAPQYLEIRSAPSASTLHFPAGTYTLEASDGDGFYYRAPRKVIKHTFGGADPFDGGIFVSKRESRMLRGYIIWAGGRTRFGNFSSTPHSFRD